jgi:recombination protein RecA
MRRYHTGVFSLDNILGGGLAKGVCEITGEDASGKSTLCLSVMREASLRGLPTALIHSEGFPDKHYLSKAGPSDFLSIVPVTGEAAMDAAYKALCGGVKVVAIDALNDFESSCDLRREAGDRTPFSLRKLAYHGLSHLRNKAIETGSLVVVVNQLRTPVQEAIPMPVSALEGTINNLCNIRLRTYREQTRNEYGKLAYIKVRIDVTRSLVCPPNTKEHGFIFGERGFDRGFELLRTLLRTGSLIKAGSYFKLPDGTTIGPGYMEAAEQINENFPLFWRYHGS